MDRFETTFQQKINGFIIAEMDIRVIPSSWPHLPLTLQAVDLESSLYQPGWVDIPPSHPLHQEISQWLRDHCDDKLAECRHRRQAQQAWREKLWE